VEHTPDPVSANLITPVRPYSGVALGLAGEHQLSNALVAVRLLEVLDDCGIRIAAKAIVHGLSQVRWPGRLEWIDVPGGRLLLDAAHNPAGARSLADYLRSLKSGPLPLVFGLSRDKNLAAMLEALGPVVSRVIATQASTPRALSAREVAQQIREAAPRLEVSVVPDALEACRAALRASREAVVGGSIFLIGEVRGRLSK
jgi:dihydrofolate synthase/folylpolyglutamate synthase